MKQVATCRAAFVSMDSAARSAVTLVGTVKLRAAAAIPRALCPFSSRKNVLDAKAKWGSQGGVKKVQARSTKSAPCNECVALPIISTSPFDIHLSSRDAGRFRHAGERGIIADSRDKCRKPGISLRDR